MRRRSPVPEAGTVTGCPTSPSSCRRRRLITITWRAMRTCAVSATPTSCPRPTRTCSPFRSPSASWSIHPSPFALPGLVHVANRIIQKRALRADERLTLRVSASDLRDHPRGRQFDMLTEASVDGGLVWTESSTYLRRDPHPALPRERGRVNQHEFGRENAHSSPSAIWRVPRNIGRRYAAVSGDVNPIHLNPLAARLFGFRRAIPHGRWLKARSLAALEGRLPHALTAEVEFKSPLLLPSTVGFASHPQDGDWTFAVAEARSGRPHLAGRVSVP